MKAPIVLFVYARTEHTRRTVESLLRNTGAADSELIIYADGARSSKDEAAVEEVWRYVNSVAGFKSVLLRRREKNLGLAESIISGVTEVLSEFERIIVLEDDMEVSKHFLNYMNEGLDRFSNDERVASIHAYCFPVTMPLPELYFLRGADCWGWATWRRGWQLFNGDGAYLLSELQRRNLLSDFDYGGTFPYSQILRDQIAGENDSWAIRWYASIFLENKLSLNPGSSLLRNIGTDASGTHCDVTALYDVRVSERAVVFDDIEVQDSAPARLAIERFFRASTPGIGGKVKRWVKTSVQKIADAK
ncbi:MAG: glycosyltransferase [Halioglobus sp.]